MAPAAPPTLDEIDDWLRRANPRARMMFRMVVMEAEIARLRRTFSARQPERSEEE